MAKSSPEASKRERNKQIKWVVTIFFVTIFVSGIISLVSDEVMASSGIFVAFLILLIIIFIGIIFDIIGMAVASADEKPFHSMAARKVPGAQESIRLLRNAERVSSICNDVVGDICGVVSGAASATIATLILSNVAVDWPRGISLVMSALAAGLTVGGKAIGKSVAVKSCTQIVHTVGRGIHAMNRLFKKKKSKVVSNVEILHRIHGHEDLLTLNHQERAQLCKEIREFLIENVSKTGGHLAGNLGAVELSVAIETVFNTMEDRLVFDVGHQSYVHKMLTGRQADFASLRQYGGMAGFPKPSESDADAFVAGHASSSVSIALGMARARTLQRKDYNVVALIGDGACTGGMAYEGMNDAAVSGEPMVVILNDNEMAIGQNVGGMSRHLSRIRSSKNYLDAKRVYRQVMKQIPGGPWLYRLSSRLKNRVKRMLLKTTMFEDMGFTYLGPADGHDLPGLIDLLTRARDLREPVLVHVVTKKGCGYSFAEEDPAKFHGIGKFDPETGKKLAPKVKTFSDSFGETMVELAEKDDRICAITAAMPGGTGLLGFEKRFPNRTFDVGIAEEHAVSMAGGLAKQGMIPVLALYSTFLQRSYDQIMQDISLLQLHVVLAIDRAGLVGDDGPTHHGVFDVGFLRQVPGMRILTPATLFEQQDMLRWAVEDCKSPVAIRYPRGSEGDYKASDWQGLEGELVKCHRQGRDVTLLTYGTMLQNVMEAAELLREQGIEATVLRLLTVSDLPTEEIRSKLSEHPHLIVVEEIAARCGIREELAWSLRNSAVKVDGIDLGRDFVPHGAQKLLYKHCGLDAASIAKFTQEVLPR